MHIDKNKNKGFTLVELVIVVAILAILVGILAPAYSKYVERSAESTDLENVRTAYGEVMIAVEIEEEKDVLKVVPLKQKKAGWQSSNTVSIAGISHSNGDPDTVHWKGDPVAGGVCEVSYDPVKGILFDWKGKNEDSSKKYFFDINEDLQKPLNESGVLGDLISKKNTYFEIDSKCQNSSMLPKVKEKLPANSLLQKGTWAYVGSPSNAPERYFYWTSVDTNEVGAGQKIPVIISTADGKYYVSESTTANRTGSGPSYVAISGHLTQADNKKIIANGQKYDSLQEAYDAYEKELTEGNYQQYKNTLQ